VRFDYFWIDFGELHLGPAPLVPNRDITFAEQTWVRWKDITPRLGVSYDLFGNGRTALKASVNKYMLAFGLQGLFGDQSSPVNRMANWVTRSWTDANGNYVPDCNPIDVNAQDLRASGGDVCGAMSNRAFGQPILTTDVDPDARIGWGKRGYNWEFSTSVQHELAPRVSLDVGYFNRRYGNFTVTDNRAVTARDYSPFSVPAPVDPRLPDGGGYVISGLYDLNPDKVGLVDNVLTLSSNFGEQEETWAGMDASVNARLSRGVFLQAGISTGRTTSDDCEIRAAVDNPSQLYCRIVTPLHRATSRRQRRGDVPEPARAADTR
jgi:hypothetical protein